MPPFKGDWDMKQTGITAIAHPADLEVATTHGVFILQDIEEISRKYKEGACVDVSESGCPL